LNKFRMRLHMLCKHQCSFEFYYFPFWYNFML
jgi:hypothetical protein